MNFVRKALSPFRSTGSKPADPLSEDSDFDVSVWSPPAKKDATITLPPTSSVHRMLDENLNPVFQMRTERSVESTDGEDSLNTSKLDTTGDEDSIIIEESDTDDILPEDQDVPSDLQNDSHSEVESVSTTSEVKVTNEHGSLSTTQKTTEETKSTEIPVQPPDGDNNPVQPADGDNNQTNEGQDIPSTEHKTSDATTETAAPPVESQVQNIGTQDKTDQGANTTTNNKKPVRHISRKANNSNSKISVQKLYCYPFCKKRKSGKGDMTRCCICMLWFHDTCINVAIPDDLSAGIWLCIECRDFPEYTRDISKDIIMLSSKVEKNVSTIENGHSSLSDKMDAILNLLRKEKASDDKDLSHQNQLLSTEISQLRRENEGLRLLAANSWPSAEDEEKAADKSKENQNIDQSGGIKGDLVESLVCGDSMLRDIRSDDDKLSILYKGGAKIEDVNNHLKDSPDFYGNLTIVVGTNNVCSNQELNQIVSEYEALIKTAKDKSVVLQMNGLFPRRDNSLYLDRAIVVNTELQKLCIKHKVHFLNNMPTFLPDERIKNEYLLPQGPHLTRKGTEQLIVNLELQTQAKYVDHRKHVDDNVATSKSQSHTHDHSAATRLTNKVIYFAGKQNDLSNFNEVLLRFGDIWFRHLEGAYQYGKHLFHGNIDEANRILGITDPKDAMLAGRKCNTNADWKRIKVDFMKSLVFEKAKQCPKFVTALLDTGDSCIVENTRNNFWGRGEDFKGLNTMGNVLFEVRTFLQCHEWPKVGESASYQTPTFKWPTCTKPITPPTVNVNEPITRHQVNNHTTRQSGTPPQTVSSQMESHQLSNTAYHVNNQNVHQQSGTQQLNGSSQMNSHLQSNDVYYSNNQNAHHMLTQQRGTDQLMGPSLTEPSHQSYNGSLPVAPPPVNGMLYPSQNYPMQSVLPQPMQDRGNAYMNTGSMQTFQGEQSLPTFNQNSYSNNHNNLLYPPGNAPPSYNIPYTVPSAQSQLLTATGDNGRMNHIAFQTNSSPSVGWGIRESALQSSTQSARFPPHLNTTAVAHSPTISQTFHEGYRLRNDSCYFCGESGHVTRSCKHGKRIVCSTCGLKGHKTKHHNFNNH